MQQIIIVTDKRLWPGLLGDAERWKLTTTSVEIGAGYLVPRLTFCLSHEREALIFSEHNANIDAIKVLIEDSVEEMEIHGQLMIVAHGPTYKKVKGFEEPGKIWVAQLSHSPEQQPYDAVKAFIANPGVATFETLCEIIKKKPTLAQRTGNIKHAIVRQFSALNMDLLTWQEQEYISDYWCEGLLDQYAGMANEILHRSCELLYTGQGAPDEDNILAVMRTATQVLVGNQLEEAQRLWDIIQILLSPAFSTPDILYNSECSRLRRARSLYEDVFGAGKLIDAVRDRNLAALEQQLRGESPLHCWLVAFSDAMNDLRHTLMQEESKQNNL